MCGYDVMVAWNLPKVHARVRFPLPAPAFEDIVTFIPLATGSISIPIPTEVAETVDAGDIREVNRAAQTNPGTGVRPQYVWPDVKTCPPGTKHSHSKAAGALIVLVAYLAEDSCAAAKCRVALQTGQALRAFSTTF